MAKTRADHWLLATALLCALVASGLIFGNLAFGHDRECPVPTCPEPVCNVSCPAAPACPEIPACPNLSCPRPQLVTYKFCRLVGPKAKLVCRSKRRLVPVE